MSLYPCYDTNDDMVNLLAKRIKLQNVADDITTTLGKDQYGNVWSAKDLPDGKQIWTQTRNGTITNGGVNQTPRTFNPETELLRLC